MAACHEQTLHEAVASMASIAVLEGIANAGGAASLHTPNGEGDLPIHTAACWGHTSASQLSQPQII